MQHFLINIYLIIVIGYAVLVGLYCVADGVLGIKFRKFLFLISAIVMFGGVYFIFL